MNSLMKNANFLRRRLAQVFNGHTPRSCRKVKMEARQVIREFVSKEMNSRQNGGGWKDSDSLLLSKKTDSLFFVDLIVFLEDHFSLKLSSSEISKEDLDSID